MTNRKPRGIRNNNPGNIRYNGTTWVGLSLPPSDGEFCVFTEPKYGIRALARIIKVYNTKYGINTVAGIIKRWAASCENDTNAYIRSVCHQTGFGAKSELDLGDCKTMLVLVKAIVQYENGHLPYTDQQILEGFKC